MSDHTFEPEPGDSYCRHCGGNRLTHRPVTGDQAGPGNPILDLCRCEDSRCTHPRHFPDRKVTDDQAVPLPPDRGEVWDAYQAGRAEEREACAKLAEQHRVRYEQRKSCSCGRKIANGGPCSYQVGPPLLFADLIRARKDTP